MRRVQTIMSHYEKAWQAAVERIERAATAAGRAPRIGAVAGGIEDISRGCGARRARGRASAPSARTTCRKARPSGRRWRDLPDVEWHLIGPLQGNKARLAAATFDWVESVDRLKIAQRLSAQRPADAAAARRLRAGQRQRRGHEERRSARRGAGAGASAVAAPAAAARCAASWAFPSPPTTRRGSARSSAALRECFDECVAAGLPMDTLSMGMSADLEAAIAEGATQVRVGTAIFGAE